MKDYEINYIPKMPHFSQTDKIANINCITNI